MVLEIKQMGGSYGSYAGDCCIIQWGKKNFDNFGLIDLGRETLGSLTYRNLKDDGKNLKFVILTHMHADHISEERNWKWAVENTEKLILPPWTTQPTKKDEIKNLWKDSGKSFEDEKTYREKYVNGKEIHKLTREETGGCEVSFIAIVPHDDKDNRSANADENEASIGLLIKVKDGENQWSMLTLGDMVRKTARESIKKVLEEEGLKNGVDVWKLPHHGSSNNRMSQASDEKLKMIGNRTTIVSSGCTAETLNRINTNYYFAQDWNNGKYYMLLGRRDSDLDSLFGKGKTGWKSYSESLIRAGAVKTDVVKYCTWTFNLTVPLTEDPVGSIYEGSSYTVSSSEDSSSSTTTAPKQKEIRSARREGAVSTTETREKKRKKAPDSEAPSSTTDATADTSLEPKTKGKRSIDSEAPSSTTSTTADTSKKPENTGRGLSKKVTDQDDDGSLDEHEVKKPRKTSSSPSKKSATLDTKSSTVSGTDDDDDDDNRSGKEKKIKKRKK